MKAKYVALVLGVCAFSATQASADRDRRGGRVDAPGVNVEWGNKGGRDGDGFRGGDRNRGGVDVDVRRGRGSVDFPGGSVDWGRRGGRDRDRDFDRRDRGPRNRGGDVDVRTGRGRGGVDFPGGSVRWGGRDRERGRGWRGNDWHHRGWSHGYVWNRSHRPRWVQSGYSWAPWYWYNTPRGYWQCTAFDDNGTPYSEAGRTEDQAAYNALYECGGGDVYECYIPAGYCRYR